MTSTTRPTTTNDEAYRRFIRWLAAELLKEDTTTYTQHSTEPVNVELTAS